MSELPPVVPGKFAPILTALFIKSALEEKDKSLHALGKRASENGTVLVLLHIMEKIRRERLKRLQETRPTGPSGNVQVTRFFLSKLFFSKKVY